MDAWLREANDKHLLCRFSRHQWKVQTKIRRERLEEDGRFYHAIHLQCSGCGGSRVDYVDRSGELAHRAYQMPIGYARKGVNGTRLDIRDIRREMMRRFK